MVAEGERKVTNSVNLDKVASYLVKRELWERADGECRGNFQVTDMETRILNRKAAMKAHKDLSFELASLSESEQKFAQAILDCDNVYEHLRKAKVDPASFKDYANQRLKSLGVEPSDKQIPTETYLYPPGTTPEAIEAFRTMYGQTPEDDIRLGTTFETFLKGFVSGRISIFEQLSDSIADLTGRVDDLERFKDATANYDSYGDYCRP